MNDTKVKVNVEPTQEYLLENDQGRLLLYKNVAVTAWMTLEFAYLQLYDNPLIKGQSKHRAATELKYVRNKLNLLKKQAKVGREEWNKLDESSSQNVGLGVELLSMCATIPHTQQDFITQAFEQIMIMAAKRHSKKIDGNQEVEKDIKKLTKKI